MTGRVPDDRILTPPADVSIGERRFEKFPSAGGNGCKTFARPTGATELRIYEAGRLPSGRKR